MTKQRVDILKIDKRGRIVIPDEIRTNFGLSHKSYFIGIGKADADYIKLTNLSENQDTATFLLESDSLPEDYETSMNEFAEKIWGLQTIIIKSGTSPKDTKKIIKEKLEQLHKELPKDYKLKIVIIEENGRFVMPKVFRKILEIA